MQQVASYLPPRQDRVTSSLCVQSLIPTREALQSSNRDSVPKQESSSSQIGVELEAEENLVHVQKNKRLRSSYIANMVSSYIYM